jgi:hypothetical protein
VKIAIVASYDSYLAAAVAVGRALARPGDEIKTLGLTTKGGTISPRQRAAAGAAEARPISFHDLTAGGRVDRHDVVIAGLSNGVSRRFLRDVRARWATTPRRPLLIGCYAGVVFGDQESLLCRTAYDLHLLNAPLDLAAYRVLCRELGIADDNGVDHGLPILAGVAPRADVATPPRTVLFAEQQVVPATAADRLRLAAGLVAYADAFPDRRLLLKPRALPEELSLHRSELALDAAIRQVRPTPPANLEVVLDPADALLARVDLCLTVSSSIAVEAIVRDVPVALLGDFGIGHDQRNPGFVGSGLITTFARLLRGETPTLDPAWRAANVRQPASRDDALRARIEAWLAEQAAAGRAAPMRPCGHALLTVDAPAPPAAPARPMTPARWFRRLTKRWRRWRKRRRKAPLPGG